MKNLKGIFLVIAAVAMLGLPAAAQFRIGPRIGTEVNSLRLSGDVKDTFSSSNRAGFTAGVEMEFTVPLIGIGCDVSAMYVRRNTESFSAKDALHLDFKTDKDYIEIPVNLKYKLNLPVVGKLITPYVFTGPSFAFLTSKKAINEAFQNKSFDVAWNVGLGLQFFSHLQVGASYGFGITKAIETVSSYKGQSVDGKNKYWTITAAWLF